MACRKTPLLPCIYLHLFCLYFSLPLPFYSILFLFFAFFSAFFPYSFLHIPLDFPFLFGIKDSRLHAGQQDGRFSFLERREIFPFATTFRPLCGVPGLITRFASERQKPRDMKGLAHSHQPSSFRMRRF